MMTYGIMDDSDFMMRYGIMDDSDLMNLYTEGLLNNIHSQ